MGKLTSIYIQKTNESGRYGDGGGLYLQISDKAHKSWIFRFMKNKKSREMGLGSLDLVSLAEARVKAAECRKVLLGGADPIDVDFPGRLSTRWYVDVGRWATHKNVLIVMDEGSTWL